MEIVNPYIIAKLCANLYSKSNLVNKFYLMISLQD